MLTPDQRRNIVLNAEGQALSLAGHCGAEAAAETISCLVDGQLNGLIRIEGREQAARFAFALADRVVGGLTEPTALPVFVAPVQVPISEAVAPVAAAEPLPRMIVRELNHVAVGFAGGFLLALALASLLH